MDLFDWLDVIRRLRDDEGLTQAQIAERIGWSRGAVSQYVMLADRVATQVLDLAKAHQEGRVAEDATHVAFNFTEWWFRTSGLYDLPAKYLEPKGGFQNEKSTCSEAPGASSILVREVQACGV